MALLGTAIEALGRTIFPPVCVACGRPPCEGGHLCGDCDADLDLLRAAPACPRCGSSSGPHISTEGFCGRCRASSFQFDGTARVAPYVDPMMQMLRRYKYRGSEYLDSCLADLMIRSLEQTMWHKDIEAIVPVPSHWMRRITEGFHPVMALAAQIGRRLHVPCLSVMRRVRFERHQIGLSLSDRIRNVQGAFALRSGVDVADACVCVVDDVMTSGATLNEVAKVLKAAGARRVYNLVLARAAQEQSTLGIA
ncbi:MAG: ComF family protein [Planctomycetes bacterium]|nr:ComF family protein [Planctomycetota bacterium]